MGTDWDAAHWKSQSNKGTLSVSAPLEVPQCLNPTTPARTFPPVIATLLADPVGVKRAQKSIALSLAKIAAPFEDMHAKLGAQVAANFLASLTPLNAQIGANLLASLAPLNAQTGAAIAATYARALPAVEPIADELFLAARRPPMASLADRFDDALERSTTVMVSTITTSVAPLASDVASIARPRFHRLRLALQIVGGFVVLVGAAEGLDWIVREVQSITSTSFASGASYSPVVASRSRRISEQGDPADHHPSGTRTCRAARSRQGRTSTPASHRGRTLRPSAGTCSRGGRSSARF